MGETKRTTVESKLFSLVEGITKLQARRHSQRSKDED